MRHESELRRTLEDIDGRGFNAYQALRGAWRFPDFELHVDHVQGDPFARPSRVRVLLSPAAADLPASAYATAARRLGTAAMLAHAFADMAADASRPLGSGRSGEIAMEHPGQKVMAQTAVRVGEDGTVEARFGIGLPARGRKVLGTPAALLLTSHLPRLVAATLPATAYAPSTIEQHAATNEDAEHLRDLLEGSGLVAFVADGARLPRRSGVDDRPHLGPGVVPFLSPQALRVSFELPNAGRVEGMGVRPGVTLVVGGGFHGKSTLLRALEHGVYNHRPGDGRERVVARADAVKVRAEDGRSVVAVDISGLIDDLPGGRDSTCFTTPNASGSTSQAAGMVEALEAGARLLLVDEDTSATNFMIRDRRMQQLVPAEAEPITPFVDHVRRLHSDRGVSCVLVLGGSGDYLDVADTVLLMREYVPEEVTARARSIAAEYPTGRISERSTPLVPTAPRVPDPHSIDPRRGRRAVHVRVPDDRTLVFGGEVVDLAAVEQLASRAQTRAIGLALAYLRGRVLDGRTTLAAALDAVDQAVQAGGLDALDDRGVGDLAAFRRFELAAALNRLRTLRVI